MQDIGRLISRRAATHLQISHGNTAAHAAEHGDKVLGRICAAIAGDEARHEKAYIKIVDALFDRCGVANIVSVPRQHSAVVRELHGPKLSWVIAEAMRMQVVVVVDVMHDVEAGLQSLCEDVHQQT